jgi:hypothetical protein
MSLRSWFCKHEWKKIGMSRVPASKPGYDTELFSNREVFGFTVIMRECEKCGSIQKLEFLGLMEDTPVAKLVSLNGGRTEKGPFR